MSDHMSVPGFHRWHLTNYRQYFDNLMESVVSTMQCFRVWTMNGGGMAAGNTPALSDAAQDGSRFAEDQRPGILPAEEPCLRGTGRAAAGTGFDAPPAGEIACP